MKIIQVLILVLALTTASFAYTLSLNKGWNLVSVPFPSVSVLSGGDCTSGNIWGYYNGNYVSAPLDSSVRGWNYGSFFVYAKRNCDLQLTNEVVSTANLLSKPNLDGIWESGGGSLNFKSGWNFVAGFTDSADVADIYNNCKIIKGPYYYDPIKNTWIQSNILNEGKGYIIKVSGDCSFGKLVSSTVTLPPLPS